MKTKKFSPHQVLKNARKFIESGGTKYICWAIEDSVRELTDTISYKHILAVKCKDRIEYLLEGCGTVASWLYDNAHCEFHEQYDIKLMQEYRLRWIDHLLENDEFFKDKSKGKS